MTRSAGWRSGSTVASPASACERCVTRDPRLVGVDLTGAVLREADAHGKHLLIRFDDGRTLHAHLRMDGSLARRAGGDRAGVAAARRAVDGGRAADRARRARARRRADERTRSASSATSAPTCAGRSSPTSTRSLERLAEAVRRAARRRPARPAQRRRVRQRLRGRAAVRRRRVAEPAGRHDRRPGRPARPRRRGDPHQRRPRPAEHDRPQAAARRPLDLRPARRPCPLCATTLDGGTSAHSPWRRVTTWCPACQPLRGGAVGRPRPGPPAARPAPGAARAVVAAGVTAPPMMRA